jgi:hypothetical protein
LIVFVGPKPSSQNYLEEELLYLAINLSDWYANHLSHLTKSRAAAANFRNNYIRQYANQYNLPSKVLKKSFPPGAFVLMRNAITHKLENRRTTQCVVVHYNQYGYKLPHLGGMAWLHNYYLTCYPHQLLREVHGPKYETRE